MRKKRKPLTVLEILILFFIVVDILAFVSSRG